MNELVKVFDNYVKNYDMNDSSINRKYYHTFRVIENIKKLAKSLNLPDEDIELASVIALFHDIARFRQWTE